MCEECDVRNAAIRELVKAGGVKETDESGVPYNIDPRSSVKGIPVGSRTVLVIERQELNLLISEIVGLSDEKFAEMVRDVEISREPINILTLSPDQLKGVKMLAVVGAGKEAFRHGVRPDQVKAVKMIQISTGEVIIDVVVDAPMGLEEVKAAIAKMLVSLTGDDYEVEMFQIEDRDPEKDH